MKTPQFDKDQYRERSSRQWEQNAAGWRRWRPAIDEMEGDLDEQIFEAAQTGPGARVLEVAAGDGSFTVKAAERVGEAGRVTATDMSEAMVGFTRGLTQEKGFSNIETMVMDGENLDFDANTFHNVFCMISLMLFADPQAALVEANRVLKPDRRYAATVFSTPDKTPWLALVARIALRHAGREMPPPGTPGLFALGNAAHLEQHLDDAGFVDVEVRSIPMTLRLSSAAECTDFIREAVAAVQGILSRLSDDQQQAAWHEIENALQQFETADGFAAPTEYLLAVGTK
jgi:ubiquinone/menaquinone biosynthesis C-methylase UbiE